MIFIFFSLRLFIPVFQLLEKIQKFNKIYVVVAVRSWYDYFVYTFVKYLCLLVTKFSTIFKATIVIAAVKVKNLLCFTAAVVIVCNVPIV